jgi:hypothetical protein
MLLDIAAAFRPLAKEVIKAGLIVYDTSSHWLGEMSEHWTDFMAEVRSELAERSDKSPPPSGSSSSHTRDANGR